MLNLYSRRLWVNRIGIALSMVAMSLGLIVLMWILWTLFSKGFAALSLDLFTQDTPAPGSEGGGLRNAIVGSGLILLFSMLIATPVGILAGIYLAEYGRISKFASFTRFMTDIMLSAPSIVIGLFVYALFVATTGGFSGWALGLFQKTCKPYGNFPSMHVGLSVPVVAANFLAGGPVIGSIMLLWAVLIAVSTLYTKQHYILDVLAGVVGGLVISTLVFWL